MVNSEENEKKTELIEIVTESANELESIAVDLYNNHDFSTAERVCKVILQLYEKIESKEDVKRMKQILQKLSLVDQYFDATFGLLKKQTSQKKEIKSEKETNQ